MANIKSAKKRILQNSIRRLRNRGRKSEMRGEIKRFRKLVEDGQLNEAKALLGEVYSVIDRTAVKGTIHSNTAARYKSSLAQLLRRETVAAG